MAKKPPATQVPPTPVAIIQIDHHGITVTGDPIAHDGSSTPQTVAAHHVARTVASELDRPVRAIATDPEGVVKLVIHPDGHTSDLEAVSSAPTQAAPLSTPPLLLGIDPRPAPVSLASPRPTEAVAQQLAERVAQSQAEPVQADYGFTVLAAPPPAPIPSVTAFFSDGQSLWIDATYIVGRGPREVVPLPEGDVIGTPLIIPDLGRSISRSHLAIGVDVDGAWIKDLRATNGTLIKVDHDPVRACAPGEIVTGIRDAIVYFGDHEVRLTCAPTA